MCHPSASLPERLFDKRAAHLKPKRNPDPHYTPKQPVWYTEDGNPDWKPGLIDGKDLHPNSYWVITENNTRSRRNSYDIKPRVPSVEKSKSQLKNYTIPEVPEHDEKPAEHEVTPPRDIPKKYAAAQSSPEPTPAKMKKSEIRPDNTLAKKPRKSSRIKKSTQQSDFVYGLNATH